MTDPKVLSSEDESWLQSFQRRTNLDVDGQVTVAGQKIDPLQHKPLFDHTTVEKLEVEMTSTMERATSLQAQFNDPSSQLFSDAIGNKHRNVVVEGIVNGQPYKHPHKGIVARYYNENANPDFREPGGGIVKDPTQTTIWGLVEDYRQANGYPKVPNGTRGSAHAEVLYVDDLVRSGAAKGAEIAISLAGREPLCIHCMTHLAMLAERSKAKKLILFSAVDGKRYYWVPGMKTLARLK